MIFDTLSDIVVEVVRRGLFKSIRRTRHRRRRKSSFIRNLSKFIQRAVKLLVIMVLIFISVRLLQNLNI